MRLRYGVPYQGSKNQIAKKIIDVLPEAENFYDLFAGGCAVTHAAMLSGKYKNFHACDIDGRGVQLFYDSIHGKYTPETETRWISREEFCAKKDTDPYIGLCWSFGNNGKGYLYGKNVEGYKHTFHDAVFFKDYEPMRKYYKDFPLEWNEKTVTERRLAMRRWICDWGKAKGQFKNGHTYITTEQSPICNSESLQRLESLQSLQSLERLETYPYKDYRDIEIKPNGIIYCDIPYRNTNQGGYAKYNFDHDSFYEWCRKQTAPVFISEYSMPDDFKVFASFPKRQLSGGNGAGKLVSENIYTL